MAKIPLLNVMYLYILKSIKDGTFYIGISSDPVRRLKEHNAGYQKSTKGRRPYQLIYMEFCADRVHARRLEKFYKSGCGREKIKHLFTQ